MATPANAPYPVDRLRNFVPRPGHKIVQIVRDSYAVGPWTGYGYLAFVEIPEDQYRIEQVRDSATQTIIYRSDTVWVSARQREQWETTIPCELDGYPIHYQDRPQYI